MRLVLKNITGLISREQSRLALILRIPHNQRYQQVVLDKTISQFLAGEVNRDQAMKQITDGWEEITNELGRDKQKAAYLGSLGVQK